MALVKKIPKSRFPSKFTKISIFFTIYKNIDFSSKKFENSRISSKFSKNRAFGHNFSKILILVKIFVNLDFRQNCLICLYLRKISILVTRFGDLDLGQNFQKIFILAKIFEKKQTKNNTTSQINAKSARGYTYIQCIHTCIYIWIVKISAFLPAALQRNILLLKYYIHNQFLLQRC